ncbi:phage tail spike protein [Bacillus sp. COPE52]|uniref:phage tail spike protein n=1 Tax=Bacillus sp. COPE52 TaxID=2233998 RepID=UPI000E104961|nr:phage tail spike protein [Bacillus sp. COPE52]AXK19120.1 hypothetical protein DPQ31_16040 [Bacillus sp. COPE52]
MDITLHKSSERNFNNLGLGVLTNIEKASVTEEANGSFELEVDIVLEDENLLQLIPEEEQILFAKANDTDKGQPFRIYNVEKDDDYSIFIRARHVSFDSKRYAVSEVTKASRSIAASLELVNGALEPKGHPFRFSTDMETVSTFEVRFKNLIDILQGSRGSLLDVYGGEITRDHWHVRYNKRRGDDTNIYIEAGKNLTGISVSINTDEVYTRIIPYAKRNDENSKDESYIELTEKYIDSPHVNDYPEPRVKIVEIDGVESESELRNKAKGYFVRNGTDIPKVNLKIEFIQLWQVEGNEELAGIERLHIGDRIHASHPEITADLSARVIKTVYDPINELYEHIEAGDYKTSMTTESNKDSSNLIERVDDDRSSWKQVVDMVTDKITGNDGGHVVLHPRENPQEIFIMDTDNVNTSKQVLRMNKEGIGFSKNGINGKFETAWTVDGVFIADFIKSGTLDTSLLKAGVIKGSKGNMVIDLSNDKMQINKGAISIVRPDGYEVISDGMAAFDLTVDAHEPMYIGEGVKVNGWWWTTTTTIPRECNVYTIRHQARYFKMHLGFFVDEGGRGRVEIAEIRGGTGSVVVAQREFTNGQGGNEANAGVTLTVDLGVPDGKMKSFILSVGSVGGGEKRAFLRKIRAWLEG